MLDANPPGGEAQGSLFEVPAKETRYAGNGALAGKYVMPPFSVLNARSGEWQTRKRAWLSLGIESELGRGPDLALRTSDPDEYRRERGLLRFSGEALRKYKVKGKEPARSCGQDLMRGEHAVGGEHGKRKTTENRLAQGCPAHAYDGGGEGGVTSMSGTSVFDPVLCELAYLWFSPSGGLVMDPFAGGSVRGIVAAKMGRRYVGVELSARQVRANRAQAEAIVTDAEPMPVWHCGDARGIPVPKPGRPMADMVFTCPPYYDLEVYSDDPRDLSACATYEEFLVGYEAAIRRALARLAPDRFAVFVVGDVRGKNGALLPFVSDTVAACQAAGGTYYNDMVLVTQVGSLPIRVEAQFAGSRKIGKTHQRVLVFVKGDPKKATAALGEAAEKGRDRE